VQQIANPSNCYFWTRYGRVGDSGVSELAPRSAAQAEKEFSQKVREKTKKGYAVIKMSLGEKQDTKEIDFKSKEYEKSKLHV
jgi:predicted DNA-binding WGR domain protein